MHLARPEKLDFHTRHMVDTIDMLTRWAQARLKAIMQDQGSPSSLAKAAQLHLQLGALGDARKRLIAATPTQGD